VCLAKDAKRPVVPASTATSAPDEYRIVPEDVLLVSAWQNAELTRTVPVRPDGKISLPLVHDVQAAGLTTLELRDLLIKRYREFDSSIELSVTVTEVNSLVSVIGKVVHPGRTKLRGPTTVLDMIAEVGGFQEYADENNVVVMRPVSVGSASPQFQRLKFNYKRATHPGGESGNFLLKPGDIVIVP
jgi:polysaccharide export outer membrane protein